MKISSAQIVCVGTELLLGDILNTNEAYIAARLRELGVPLYRSTSVGDNPDRLKAVIGEAIASSDLVITTGGLGPTDDDLTKETVADLLGLPLVHDGEAEENIRARLRGRPMSPGNLKQAQLPQGSCTLYNSCGTAPGVIIEKGSCAVVMLPGVPHEMREMFLHSVIPYIKERSDALIRSRNLYVCGMGESRVDEVLGDLTSGANPTLAPYCKSGETRLRISARAQSEAEAAEMIASLEARVRETEVGEHIYFASDGIESGAYESCAYAAFRALADSGRTVAFAESITGGLCAKMISDIPGASAVLRGSAVTYATDTKTSVLGVNAETVEKYGVVSEQTAAEMARGARERFGSDIAVSTTGIADSSPYGDGRGIEPGTVCIGFADGARCAAMTVHFGSLHTREYVRALAAGRVMHLICGFFTDDLHTPDGLHIR